MKKISTVLLVLSSLLVAPVAFSADKAVTEKSEKSEKDALKTPEAGTEAEKTEAEADKAE